MFHTIMVRKYRWLSVLLSLIFALGTASSAVAADNDSVSFGVPPWPGERVKAEVATRILEAIGYETKKFQGADIFILNSVAHGEPDIYLAVWRPINDATVEPLLESGEIVLLNTNIGDAKYNLAVPQYVWDAGVHSISDLQDYADRFGHKIYGIEIGATGNTLMIHAIEDDTYNLGEWRLVSSSTAGMLAQVTKAVSEHDWIVFTGWRPHWMNIEFDLQYLQDPLNLWGPNGGQSQVQTIAGPTFVESHPNVTRFLKQMDVGSKVQSTWIYNSAYKNNPAEQVAAKWIKSHPDVVGQWLDGVTTADGERPAVKAVRKHIGFSG